MIPVEVAGLALAVLPIIMEAAEYRCGSLKPALHQKTKDDKMADCYQEIHNELALLGACLRSLVKDLSTLPETQRESLLQLQQQAWNDPAVSRALEQRLGDSHQAFQHTLADILCRLDAIVSNQALKLDRKDLLVSGKMRSPVSEAIVARHSQRLRLSKRHDHCMRSSCSCAKKAAPTRSRSRHGSSSLRKKRGSAKA